MFKLLIVDDEKIIREMIAEHIDWNSLGVEVIGTAKDGIEAYDMILDYYPDIVMTDIKMPGLSGLELLARIKKVNQDVEFIILSGYGEFSFAQEAMQAGVRHYLLKPCNEGQIMESVRQVIQELAQKKAFRSLETPDSSIHQLSDTMILNIINEGVALHVGEAVPDFSGVYRPYRKFIDFEQEPYELCYLYFADEDAREEILAAIAVFKEKFAPSIPFHAIYVHQTLLFFFQSFHYDYQELDAYLAALRPSNQTVSIVYKRVTYPNLAMLLDKMILRIQRYDTIYYAFRGEFISICNYRNVIRSVESFTSDMYRDFPGASQSLHALLGLLSQISDPLFLKQLLSSVIMLSSSKTAVFSSLEATEFLLEMNSRESCREILELFRPKIEEVYHAHHASSVSSGNLSARVDEYVRKNLSDSNLSLKWIAENYLYMNVDYVSRRFLQETGKKFSRYLTELRIQKAKELLALNGCDKIQSIAESVGCGNNPQYFSQLFKKETGVTPSNYIKYMSGGNQNDK